MDVSTSNTAFLKGDSGQRHLRFEATAAIKLIYPWTCNRSGVTNRFALSWVCTPRTVVHE
jgi:hypothetical protein